MAVLTLAQLKTIFRDVTVDITELDSDSGVRNTYPAPGQPAWKIDEDVAFVTVQPVDNLYDKLRDVTWGDQEPVSGQEVVSDYSTTYTRVMAVDWIIYGPNSFDLADKLRFGILSANVLATLAEDEIAPLTEIAPPRRAPELFNGQWWERSDLRVLFNVLTTRTETVPYLDAAEIQLHTQEGLQATIEIEE